MSTIPERVVIAMSGGVDSSVAAALLVQQGYQVIGMMMRLWSEPERQASNRCCSPDSMAMARRVAARLDIPFYTIDAKDIFHETVVSRFANDYIQGITPNPCLICNRYIRWEFLLNHALALDASYLATGHYVRINRNKDGSTHILQAIDRAKDQSYVLHVLGQEQLAHALFPLGEFTKTEVREMARKLELPVAERPESQDLCFLGGEDYRDFLKRYAPGEYIPGAILSQEGEVLGQHLGLAFYTIGQRRGLGISSQIPLYVLNKDIQRNALIVGPQDALGLRRLVAGPINWISGKSPPLPLRSQVKIRYKAPETWATINPHQEGFVEVEFDLAMRDITPGQAVVFYQDDLCLGGGIIQR